MKRLIIALIAVSMLVPAGCKKEEVKKEEGPIGDKYAKYRVVVRKDKDLKNWLATLEKAEKVQLLSEEDYKPQKGNTMKLARVKLADDSVGYLEASHLADKAIVFIEDTKALLRPTLGSQVRGTIPKGKVGFVIGEKGNWYKVYVGKINNVWITSHWVNGGYSTDEMAIQEAKVLEAQMEILVKGPEGENNQAEKFQKALEKVKEIAEGTSVIAQIARDELKNIGEAAGKNTGNEHPTGP